MAEAPSEVGKNAESIEKPSDIDQNDLSNLQALQSYENGYTRVEELQDAERMFETPERDLEVLDRRADESYIFSEPAESARILAHYFGQHSCVDEELSVEQLHQLLEEREDLRNLPELESDVIMHLDTMEYDGSQHIKYREGVVAEELLDYIVEESGWSENTYLNTDGTLFIQSSP